MGTSPGLSPGRPPRSGSLPPGEEVASLTSSTAWTLSCRSRHKGQAELSLGDGHHTPSQGIPFWDLGRAGPLGRGRLNAAKGAHLCFALHGDRQERGGAGGGGQRRKRVRGGEEVRVRGSDRSIDRGAGAPLQGQPRRAGTLPVPGKRGGKLPTGQMQENWILQPFTLLLGPL